MIHPGELKKHNYVCVHLPLTKDGAPHADDRKIFEVSEICGDHIRVFGLMYPLFAGNLTPVSLSTDILNPAVFVEETGSYRFKEVRLVFRDNLMVSVYRDGFDDEISIFTLHQLQNLLTDFGLNTIHGHVYIETPVDSTQSTKSIRSLFNINSAS